MEPFWFYDIQYLIGNTYAQIFYLQAFMFTTETHLFVHDPDHLLDYPTVSKYMPPKAWNLVENEKEIIDECKPTHPDG